MIDKNSSAYPTANNYEDPEWAASVDGGETKREKAFWLVYSSFLGNAANFETSFERLATKAINAVDAGFKILDKPSECLNMED